MRRRGDVERIDSHRLAVSKQHPVDSDTVTLESGDDFRYDDDSQRFQLVQRRAIDKVRSDRPEA